MSSRNNDEVNGMIFDLALIGAAATFLAAVVYALAAFAAIVLTLFAISMDGKGAWRDNVLVERLWRSVKYEEVYLRAYDSVSEARASIARYFAFSTSAGRIRRLTGARRARLTSARRPTRRRHSRRGDFDAALVGLRPPAAASKSQGPAFSVTRQEST